MEPASESTVVALGLAGALPLGGESRWRLAWALRLPLALWLGWLWG